MNLGLGLLVAAILFLLAVRFLFGLVAWVVRILILLAAVGFVVWMLRR
ncbi:MAG: hypothetical protein QJR08_04660 [Bacillota bacterium]|nr:hypothetical protein [Bacillota bacterium]